MTECAANYTLMKSLPWYFQLREEATQGWRHFYSNKLVYVSKVLDRQLYSALFISEEDFDVRPWIETHLMLVGQRNGDYLLIIESPFLDRNSARDFEESAGLVRVKPDDPVLIRIPEEIETPERVGFVRLPVVVRLKRLHPGDCFGGHAVGGSGDPSLCARAIYTTNRETRFRGGTALADLRQFPSKMFQGSPQVTNEVSRNQAKTQDVDCPYEVNCNSEEPPFQILMCRDEIRIFGLTHERGVLDIESIQVFLRPLHFKVSLLRYHDWPLLSEVFQKTATRLARSLYLAAQRSFGKETTTSREPEGR